MIKIRINEKYNLRLPALIGNPFTSGLPREECWIRTPEEAYAYTICYLRYGLPSKGKNLLDISHTQKLTDKERVALLEALASRLKGLIGEAADAIEETLDRTDCEEYAIRRGRALGMLKAEKEAQEIYNSAVRTAQLEARISAFKKSKKNPRSQLAALGIIA